MYAERKGFHTDKWQLTKKGKTRQKGKNDKGDKGRCFQNKAGPSQQPKRFTTAMPFKLRGGVLADDMGEAICYGVGLGEGTEAPASADVPEVVTLIVFLDL